MATCDLCNTSTHVEAGAKRYTASEMKTAARSGLRPPAAALRLLMLFGRSQAEAEKDWMESILMPDNTDWLLCPDCSSICENHLSVPKTYKDDKQLFERLTTELATETFIEITDSTFDETVLESELPVLLAFAAPWCKQNKEMAPILKELVQEYNGKVIFTEINTDTNHEVANKYGIRAIPTFMIFKEGEVADTVVGIVSQERLTTQLDAVLVPSIASSRARKIQLGHQELTKEEVQCPYCTAYIELDAEESKTRRFICPECGREVDLNVPKSMLASTGQRFGTLVLDTVFLYVFGFVLGLVLGAIGLADLILNTNEYLLSVLIYLLYYIPQEAFSGQTLGKLITGTKAVSKDGAKLTFGQTIGRTLCRFIPFEAFSFFGGQGRPEGWHDRIPQTKVISTKLGRGARSRAGETGMAATSDPVKTLKGPGEESVLAVVSAPPDPTNGRESLPKLEAYCTSCGAPYPEGARFCGSCGAQLIRAHGKTS